MSRWTSVLAAFLLLGCLRPSEDNAEWDLRVGEAEVDGARFAVVERLAAFRSAAPAALHLWAQAPVLEIDAELEAAGTWTLTFENVLADATLAAEGAPVELVSRPRPTVSVWTVALPAGETRLRLAPPDAGDRSPWRFAVLSDIQEAVDEVDEVFAVIGLDPDIRFVVSTGDLTESGSRKEVRELLRQLEVLDVPFYSTQGNHERGASPEVWADIFGRSSFHWTFRGVHFTFADSGAATIDPTVYGWLDDWLAAGADAVHVFLTHYTPIDPVGTRNGSFRSRKEAAKLLTRLARGDVDVTLYGHVHSYYAFSNAGIPAYISGGGGAVPERLDGIARHFLSVDVDPARAIERVAVVRVD